MYKLILLVSALFLTAFSFGQKDTVKEVSQDLPPIEMLPKNGEVKQIYEMPGETQFKIYDQNGNFISEGFGQFIDYTEFEKGVYFIRYEGKSESFRKE